MAIINYDEILADLNSKIVKAVRAVKGVHIGEISFSRGSAFGIRHA